MKDFVIWAIVIALAIAAWLYWPKDGFDPGDDESMSPVEVKPLAVEVNLEVKSAAPPSLLAASKAMGRAHVFMQVWLHRAQGTPHVAALVQLQRRMYELRAEYDSLVAAGKYEPAMAVTDEFKKIIDDPVFPRVLRHAKQEGRY